MSLQKSATIRHALLGASSLILAAVTLTPAAAQQATGPEIAFPASGLFPSLSPTAGNDTVTVADGTALYLPLAGSQGGMSPGAYSKNFLGGMNTVNNNGYVFAGAARGDVVNPSTGELNFATNIRNYEAEMRFVNLTTFNNDGAIYLGGLYYTNFGAGGGGEIEFLVGTDRWHDDMLSMEGAHFAAGDNSRIFLDADFNGVGQLSCSAALRSTEAGDGGGTLPANDCINLTGGSVSGRTLVNVTDVMFGDRGAYNPEGNVVVDLAGGDSEQINPDAFVIDPETAGYDPHTGVIDRGLFAYALDYDAEAQQFRLYGVQAAASQQFPLLTHAASDLWRTSSGGWFERQIGLRADGEAGRGGGVWGRLVSSTADRGVTTMVAAGAGTLAFNNSYEQEDDAVTFGLDLVSADGAGGSWALGGMIGYARSRIDFADYDNSANLEGMHGGLYGAFSSGAFFLDAAVNGTWLDLDNDVPVMDLDPAGTVLGTTVNSFGGRVEAGWRFRR
ncbi:MAG TPA: autotransporter domain-containing protein, partial [Caulobacteraceae bacterium]|nr:autotransporter domain-containing protein [Caulobacteraceae bacterium]